MIIALIFYNLGRNLVGFLRNIRFSGNTELVLLLLLGIVFQISDGSPFQIKQQLEKVWSTDLPEEHFAPVAQQIIKTVLSAIVAIRCGTTSLYVIFSMLVIFCIIKDRAPKLILLWLFISGVKSVGMTFIEALIGMYVCSAFGKIQKACIEFFISKALEIIFAAYLWSNVLSAYQDMDRRMENNNILRNLEISYFKKLDFKRQRARSLLDESTLYKTACLNNFEFKDVPQIILQMLRRPDEISQDSLLGPGMMLASVSNMGSYDNLKISESLGELGYTNLTSTEVVGLDGEENLSPPEKALKFLKMTWSDVRRIKENHVPLKSDIFVINSDIWFGVTSSDSRIYQPKQVRTEICIRELPPLEFEEDPLFSKKHLKKLYDLKLGVSLFNLIKKCENESEVTLSESEEEEEEDDEEREDEEMAQIIMSNMKEEKPVNRIRLHLAPKKNRGTAYSKLYTKDFMSVIGPELFDKAPKLLKINSFSIKTSKKMLSESSLFKNQRWGNLSLESSGSDGIDEYFTPYHADEERISFRHRSATNQWSEGLEAKEQTVPESTFEPTKECDPSVNEPEFSRKSSDTTKAPNESSCSIPPREAEKVKILKKKFLLPFCRKRKITIRWGGKLKKNNLRRSVSISSCISNNSHESSEFQNLPETNTDPDKTSQHKIRFPSVSSISSEKSDNECSQNRQVYFLTELLHRPFPEVLKNYYDLKTRVLSQKRLQMISEKQLEYMDNLHKLQCLKKSEENCEFGEKRTKVWKSKVLNEVQVGVHQKPITGDFITKIEQDVRNKLLKYQYSYLTSKLKENIANDILSLIQIAAEESQNEEETFELSSHSESHSHDCLILPECDNDSEGNDTPSEHSIEVCLKDLTTEEKNNSEHLSANSRCYSIEEESTSASEKTLLFDTTDDSCCSQISDEMISPYCSNAASSLLEGINFIYPDHIHYKHVKRKDVNLDEALPLLFPKQHLVKKPPKKEFSTKPDSEITSRPMDLSFAKNNSFGWQESMGEESMTSNESTETSAEKEIGNAENSNEKGKKATLSSNDSTYSHHVYFTQNYIQLIKNENQSGQGWRRSKEERTPVQISSTQLHSNKGRISATYSPALRLEENKKEAKKKAENQKRKKELLERLERQILLQKKNGFDPKKPL